MTRPFEFVMLNMEQLAACRLCPRQCSADRLHGKSGICGVSGTDAYVARAALHFWEEPCISGEKGSGTVFFAGCSLHCVYCQNAEISGGTVGKAMDCEMLADAFLRLQKEGAENINLVTPTHYAVQIYEALIFAKKRGLIIPVVYNTGGYESKETLRALQGLIDIYLTDFKYMDADLAAHYSHAADYPEAAREALAEMVRQQPACVFDERGMMIRGVMVRHLVLPGHVREAGEVISYIYKTYGDSVYISLMNQYTPMCVFPDDPLLSRKLTKREYKRAVELLLQTGVTNAYIQEGETAKESFIPPFDLKQEE